MLRFISWCLEEILLAYLAKMWLYASCSLGGGAKEAGRILCCPNSTGEQQPEKEKANCVGRISAPPKCLAKIPPTSTAFYSMAACPCVWPETLFNGTVLISSMTTPKGSMQPSPFLLCHSTCALSSRQHLFTCASGNTGRVFYYYRSVSLTM